MRDRFNKKNIFIILLIIMGIGIGYLIDYSFFKPTPINAFIASKIYKTPANSYFNDDNFYQCVVDAYNKYNSPDVAYTTSLSDDKLEKITELYCGKGRNTSDDDKVRSVSGIDKLINLENLHLERNELVDIDLSSNIKLKYLYLGGNKLTKLNLNNNVDLRTLDIDNICFDKPSSGSSCASDDGNEITELDLSNNILLDTLYIVGNPLQKLNITKNTKLTKLQVSNTKLTSLDVSKNVMLERLSIVNYGYYEDVSQITSLNISNNISLITLDIGSNEISNLDLSNNSSLTNLGVGSKLLTSLDLSNNIKLRNLHISGSQITNLDLSNNPRLQTLDVDLNKLDDLDLSKNVNLSSLSLSSTKVESLTLTGFLNLGRLYLENNVKLTDLRLSGLASLVTFNVRGSPLRNLDLSSASSLTSLDVRDNQLTSLDVSNNTALTSLVVYNNQLTSLDVSKNIALKTLWLNDNQLTELDVSNNTALEDLWAYNNQLTSLNVSNNTALKELLVDNNQLTSLDVINNTALTSLVVYNNQLTELDVSKNTALTRLDVRDNQLTNLDVSKNTVLTSLDVSDNQLTELDVSNNTALTSLSVSDNQLTELDVSNNTALTRLYVRGNKLTNLDVSNNTALTRLDVKDNQLTELDVINNTALINLDVRDNKLTSLDLSQNTLLSLMHYDIDIRYNPYSEILYLFKGDAVTVGNNVKIPSHLNWSSPSWSSQNINVATVDENGIVSGIKVGFAEIVGTVSGKYTTTSTVNVIEITSDRYEIDNINNYIFVDSDNDVNTIKSNINVSDKNITIDVDLENYKLQVKYKEQVLKEFDIVGISSSEYDLSKDYIYVGTNEIDESKLNLFNCISVVEDNKLLIKHNDTILKEIKLVSISSKDYDLSKDYIYLGSVELDESKVNLVNCTSIVEDNKLYIKYEDTVLDEYVLVSISSDVYDLSKDYIYIGAGNIDTSNISIINGNIERVDDKLVIKYNDDEIIFEYNLINFKFNNYKVFGKKIVVLEEVSYDNFIKDIVGNNGLTFKLFNGNNEVTSGNVLVDMLFKVYYNDIEVDEYTITDVDEYLNFDESLEIDEENTIINKVKSGTSIKDIYSKIDTSGEVSILDNEDKIIDSYDKNIGTGNKFKIVLSSETLYYTVSVRGDINGNGLVEINDLVQVSKHVVKGNVITGTEYLNASDINSDTKIDINDIVRLAKHIVKKTEL